MAKTNRLYKSTYNQCLDRLRAYQVGDALPPEVDFANRFGTSRTTVRAVLGLLREQGIVEWHGRRKQLLRAPRPADYYQALEIRSTEETIETAFMQWVLGGDLAPGTFLNESDLARRLGVSTSALREFLIRFSRFGLIEKQPNRHWVLSGFTKEFALELSDVREMFELRSVATLTRQVDDPHHRRELDRLEAEHQSLRARIGTDYLEFSRLDDRFHRFLNATTGNRFINDFQDLISLIFHYHYRWKKSDERERNAFAIEGHLRLIAAIKTGDVEQAEAACLSHLQSARQTLVDSVRWD